MLRDPCVTLEGRTYTEEIALVHELAAQGEPTHTLHHCLAALALEPEREEWHTPLRALLRDDTLADRLRSDAFFGAQAAYAFWLHDRERTLEAIELVTHVQLAMPHLGFHRWLERWLEAAMGRGLELDATLLVRVLLGTTSIGVGRLRLLPAEREAAEQFVPLAERARVAFPRDERIALLASSLLRKAGRLEEALAVAEAMTTTAQSHTMKGLALRALGRTADALATFEAAQAATGDATYILERMRVLADAGAWARALEAFAELEAVCTPNDEDRMARSFLEHAARTHAPPPNVPPLDDVRRRALGHGALAPMRDATANALRQIGAEDDLRARGPEGAGAALRRGHVRMSVEGVEGPSNRLCLALMLTGEPDPLHANYTISGTFDLGDEKAPFALWRREGDALVQAMSAPPEPVREWIGRVAASETDGFELAGDFLDLYHRACVEVLPSGTTPRDWVAATVYPRMPAAHACTAPEWVLRWQVVALLGLTLSDFGASVYCEALAALLRGPLDWPLAAAMRVAAETALYEPETTRELRQLLLEQVPRVRKSEGGYVDALRCALGMLPLVPEESLRHLQPLATESEPAPEAPPAAEPAAPHAAAPRPWWKFWS